MPANPGANPDVLECRYGGGWRVIAGAAFLLLGVGGLGQTLAAVHAAGPSLQDYGAPCWILPFVLVGAGLVLPRWSIVLDRRAGIAFSWWGLPSPVSRSRRLLSEMQRVTLSCEVRSLRNSTYRVYLVQLVGACPPLVWCEARDGGSARREAERVAAFLGLPLADASAGEPVVRAAERLNESLRDRVRRTGEEIRVPEAPPSMAAWCRAERQRLDAELPAEGISGEDLPRLGVGLMIACLFPVALFALLLLGDGALWQSAGYSLAGLLVLTLVLGCAGWLIGGVLAPARQRVRLRATPESLRFERRGLLGVRALELPTRELEELILAGMEDGDAARGGFEIHWLPGILEHRAPAFTRGIVARSDRAIVTFGRRLDRAEAAYLHAALMRVLTC